MADTKITGLTNFDSSNTPYWPPAPASDVIPIVDISDATMAASGTTKKISINNLLSSSPTATGALTVTGLVTAGSATITGDLTVDTSTLKVDSTNDRVGIGTATPYSTAESLNARTTALTTIAAFATMPLTVTDSTAFALGVGGGINFRAKLTAAAYSDYAAIWSYRESATNSDYAGSLIFGTSDNSNGYPIERLSVTSTGNVKIANGNLVMSTSGKGIDFSAVTGGTGTATANVLNDYEEGTFTATLKGATTDPTTPVTATGRYTKIGRQVTVQVYFSNVVTTGASGRIGVSGLPFANNGSMEAIGAVGFYDIATFTGSPFAQIGFNATQLDIYSSVSNSVYQAVTHNAGTGRYLWLNLTYTV